MMFKLKGKRVEQGIKLKDFAKELGITTQYLLKIEKGIANPRIDLAKKMSNILNTSIEDLFF